MAWWPLIIALVSFALQLILTPKPQEAKPASLEDFTAPTAEEDREVPVLFGTKDIKAPNVVWYGDLKLEAVKGDRRYGLFGPKPTIAWKYFLGMHMGLIHGPADFLLGVDVGDKNIFKGDNPGTSVTVNEPDLFGGTEVGGGGGITGTFDVDMGAPTQGRNSYLVTQLGSNVPAYRGIMSIVLRQMYLGTSPFIAPWHFLIQRILLRSDGTAQWYPSKAAIPCGDKIALKIVVDLSPSMAGSRLQTVKIGLNLVMDKIRRKLGENAYTLNMDMHMLGNVTEQGRAQGISNIHFEDNTPMTDNDVDLFKDYINEMQADAHDDDWQLGGESSRVWFELSANGGVVSGRDENVTQKILIWLSDGDAPIRLAGSGGDPPAAGTAEVMLETLEEMADILDTQTGFLSGDRKVDCYAINIESTNKQYTSQVDNTTSDAIPNMKAFNFSPLLNIIDSMGTDSPVYQDMNPAHIIREALTDKVWGMGYNESDIDDTSFTAAADALHSEGFGLTFLWQREESINEFITTVLSHIDAYVFTSITTGKFTIKLIRDDYDIDTIPVLTEDEIQEWTELDRRQPADIVNTVAVKFYNRPQAKDAAVTIIDIAQVAQAGGVSSITRNYPGILCAPLAARVGARDLKSLSSGMTTGSILAKRVAESLNPGDPFRLFSPRHKLNGEVMRVAEIRLGDGRENVVPITIIQDVFSLGEEVLVRSPPTKWVNPNNIPEPVDPRVVHEMPWFEMVAFFGVSDASLCILNDVDAGFMEAYGPHPTPDALHAKVSIDELLGAGFIEAPDFMSFDPTGVLSAALTADPTDTSIVLTGGVDLTLVEVGSLAAIVGATPFDAEFVRVDVINAGAGTLTIGRGCLDSLIKAHASGAILLFFTDFAFSDMVKRSAVGTSAAPNVIDVKLKTVTGIGKLDEPTAPTDTIIFNSRAYRPYRPADAKVNSIGIGPIDLVGVNPIPTTWARRNRITELNEIAPLDWNDADQTPEAGQTTTITLTDSLGAFLFDYTGIGGVSQNVDPSDFAGEEEGFIKFKSVRDGYDSWQEFQLEVFLEANFLILEDSGSDVLLLEDDGSELRLEA